jgi:hypothetical protein
MQQAAAHQARQAGSAPLLFLIPLSFLSSGFDLACIRCRDHISSQPMLRMQSTGREVDSAWNN